MKTIEFTHRDIAEEQAASWVAKIDRGLNATEQQVLCEWLQESPVHGDALMQLATMWDCLDVLGPISKLLPFGHKVDDFALDPPKFGQAKPRSDFMLRRLAMAAGLAVVTVGVLFNFESLPLGSGSDIALIEARPLPAEQEAITSDAQIYSTAVGERSDITLADGSEIELNTNSEIIVQFSSLERRVVLRRGEAFFKVKTDTQRAFVVLTNQRRVTAVGTAFSVDVSGAKDTEVLVSEGKVKVDHHHFSSAQSGSDKVASGTATASPLYLTKGQRAVLSTVESTVTIDHDIDSSLAWREGRVVFSGETMQQVVREIGRYSPLQFKITDPDIASIQVGGFFKTGDLTQLLVILEQNFGVKSERRGDQIILSKVR